MLVVRDLIAGYKHGVAVLHGVSFNLAEGEVVGVLGLNGSGKSTLGKAIMNLLPYQTGKIIYGGLDISGMPTHRLKRMGIGYMGQGGVVFNNLSVLDNLRLSGISIKQFDKLAENIPLLNHPRVWMRRTMADTLSGGQRMQLALAMALADSPRLVILDEPSAGLAPGVIDDMYYLLSGLHQSSALTILLIEQAVNKAVSFCDSCVIMESGKISGSIRNATPADIERCYFDFK